MFEFISNNVY